MESFCKNTIIFSSKVEPTKPLSSRFESTEIFYVYRHLKLQDGDKVDPIFIRPKEVFHEAS